MNILPIDELNTFANELSIHFEDGKIRSERDKEDIIDELLDLYLLAYASGTEAANADLGTSIDPTMTEIQTAIDEPVAGETWRERVERYYADGGNEFDIVRIAETDMTRIYNTAVLDVARVDGSPNIMKRWQTMMDDKVRETHDYLQSMVVPINADFYTYDGDHAPAPGMFTLASNNANCRCTLQLIRG